MAVPGQTPNNIKPDIVGKVTSSPEALLVAQAMNGHFTVTFIGSHRVGRTDYQYLHLKPLRATADALLIDQEVVALLTSFDDVQVRSVQALKEIISRHDRLYPRAAVVLHRDPAG